MANVTYSKADEKLILGMKKGLKGKPTDAALKKVAKKLGKSTGAIYQKYIGLLSRPKLHKAVTVTATPPVTSPAKTASVAPMKFQEIDFVPRGNWISPEEEATMKAGLDDALKNSFPKGKSLVFPVRYMDRAREYLKEVCPKGSFVFYSHTDKKNTTHKILSKKN